MTRAQKEFITKLFADASNFRGIQVTTDEDCLVKLQNIIEQVQYLPNSENSTLYEEFIRLPSPVTRDFSFVQLMLVKSTQSASFESKFHDNYLSFLEKIGSDTLYDEVVLTTCVISKAPLCPQTLLDPTLNQIRPGHVLPSSEFLLRVLKNLGGWLGKLVVSTKRFLCKTIDLKSLIIEAYERGLMSKTIPFVLEFFEPCSKSPMFKISNHTSQLPRSYVMVLRLLSEIYSMPGLQTTLVSSIEDLFDSFGVTGPIQPTSLLANLSKKGDDNPDFIDNESYITGETHDQQLSTH